MELKPSIAHGYTQSQSVSSKRVDAYRGSIDTEENITQPSTVDELMLRKIQAKSTYDMSYIPEEKGIEDKVLSLEPNSLMSKIY